MEELSHYNLHKLPKHKNYILVCPLLYLHIMNITTGLKLVTKRLKVVGVCMGPTVNNDIFVII